MEPLVFKKDPLTKIEVSKSEIAALKNILDEFSATIGCGEDDTLRIEWLKKADKMLKRNKLPRLYK